MAAQGFEALATTSLGMALSLGKHDGEVSRDDALARVWGVEAASLPRKGKSAYELLDSLGPAGGVRALLVMGSNVAVAAPHLTRVESRLPGSVTSARVMLCG